MATNIENKPQVKNLDTEEQRQEAVELLIRYTKASSEIRNLKSDLNDTRFSLTQEQKRQIEGAISAYVEKRKTIEAEIKETYNLDKPIYLIEELKKRGIDFKEYKSQQEQDQLQRIAQQQDAAREEFMEKSAKTIEAAQDYIDELKKAKELIEQEKYYEAQEIEVQKAFEAMQQANYELYQSYQHLMEVMGEKLPTRQQGAKILHGEIQEGFGAEKVDEIITFAERFKLKVEKIKAEVKEQPQAQEKQQGQKRGLTHEMP